jgi:ADP-ribose pyrophosphatase YjhB (NUDIX family)
VAFCTHCGQPLTRSWVEEDACERDVCGCCHTVHYDNPKVLIACFVQYRAQVVLCRRAVDPAKGYWYPPTGFVESGETPEEAAARELEEEAGLEIPASLLMLYGVVNLPRLNQIYIVYRTELSTKLALKPGRESLEVRFFSEAELPWGQLAFDEMANGILQKFFDRMRTGNFPVYSITIGRAPPGNSARYD